MKVKNVIIVCDYAYIEGGAAKVAINTAVSLAQNTELNVIFFAGCGKACSDLTDSNVTVVELGLYDLLGNPSKINAMVKGIYNSLVYNKFNEIASKLDKSETVVHIHTYTKVLTSAVFKAAQRAGIPVYVTVHDYFLACPNGGCFNYVKNEICEIKPMSLKCILCNCDSRNYIYKIWRCVRQFKQNSVIRKNHNINYVYISEFSKKQLQRRMPAVKNEYMLKNLIECGERFRVKAEENEIFLFIGRVSAEKGAELFCKAVAKAGVNAVVIGDGSIKERLQQQYADITFTGWLDKSKINEWIAKARCLIFPSLWYEGAPLTVLEAQAYGIPCIVTDCCAASMYVTEKNGFVVKAEPERIAEAMNKFNDNNIVKAFSENTYASFDEKRCSEEIYVRNLIEIYNG